MNQPILAIKISLFAVVSSEKRYRVASVGLCGSVSWFNESLNGDAIDKAQDIAVAKSIELNVPVYMEGELYYDPRSNGLNALRDLCHARARQAGWHDKPRESGTFLCLIHSEISEAMEGERKDLMDDKLPHRKMAEVELADAIIRIGDYAGLKGYDIEGAVVEKLEYNLHREDHKREVREQANGKAF